MHFQDKYSHPSKHITYIDECITTNDVEDEYFQEYIHQCLCTTNCTQCECITNFGSSYTVHDKTRELILIEKTGPVFECNNKCTCVYSCGNRLVQNGPRSGLSIVKINDQKMLGLITLNPIPKGGYICEYAGEIITQDEAQNRYQFNKNYNRMNYILTMKEYCGDKEHMQTFIDAGEYGNIGRYINHSCDPNCIIVPVRINHPVPKIGIFAQCDINANTELCYDYGFVSKTSESTLKPCYCLSLNCRGTLPFTL